MPDDVSQMFQEQGEGQILQQDEPFVAVRLENIAVAVTAQRGRPDVVDPGTWEIPRRMPRQPGAEIEVHVLGQ